VRKEIKNRFKGLATLAVVMSAAALTGCASTGVSSSNAPLGAVKTELAVETNDNEKFQNAHISRTGEAYLMRGLANVFSRGMDVMAKKLRHKGVDAISFSHADWKPIARDILARNKQGQVSYPIIIMGHSLGGNQSSHFANYLASGGVKVKFVATFDPTVTGYVGPNIEEVVNYYLPREADNRVLAKAGFEGSVKNIDVTVDPEVTHTNVEKNAAFQSASIKKIMSITSKL